VYSPESEAARRWRIVMELRMGDGLL